MQRRHFQKPRHTLTINLVDSESFTTSRGSPDRTDFLRGPLLVAGRIFALMIITRTSAHLAFFQYMKEIRAQMRQMGTLSGVPIEPVEQTRLLDTCVSLAGVIGGGVPGGKYLEISVQRSSFLIFFS